MPINGIIGGTRLPDGTPSSLSGVHTVQQHQEWVSRGRYNATAILATALWRLDASLASSVLSSGSPAADNANVTAWNDITSGARHVTMLNQPVYKHSVVNGKNAILFDGIDDYGTYTSVGTLNEFTLYAVVQRTSLGSGYDGVVAFANRLAIYSRLSSGQWGVYRVQSPAADQPSGITLGVGETAVLAVQRTSNDLRVLYTRRPSLSTVFISAGTDASSGYASMVGIDGTSGQAHAGYLCEIIGFSQVHSDLERNAVIETLAAKWGVT